MFKWFIDLYEYFFPKKKKAPKLPPDLPDEEIADPKEEGGTTTSLWKPMSDAKSGARKGKGVLIIECKYRWGDIKKTVTADELLCVREYRAGYANGNRMHMFLEMHGRRYGKLIDLIVPLKGGGHLYASIPDGSKRKSFNFRRIK